MKVLVPVDGSEASLRALQFALKHAKGPDAYEIILLNVQNMSTLGIADAGGVMPPVWIEEEEKKANAGALKEPRDLCVAAGVPFRVRSERGGIAPMIDQVARQEHVGHIYMGTRGLGGVRGLLLGSVAMQLLHLTDVPVTLVK